MIDGFASQAHWAQHVGAVIRALPPSSHGAAIAGNRAASDGFRTCGLEPVYTAAPDRTVLVASSGDLRRMRRLGRQHVALIEHGSGQSYGGDRHSARNSGYAGGRGRDADLFLHPGPHPAIRDQEAYPEARVAVVGSPYLDLLPERTGGPGPVVALAFHPEMLLTHETRSAFRWIVPALSALVERFTVIGTAHPWMIAKVTPWYRRLGIELVPDFLEVCRRADVLVWDNTSVGFAFAATGRPTVLLTPPAYRPEADHGLRFYECAGGPRGDGPARIGVNVLRDRRQLVPAVEQALALDAGDVGARERALDLVYAHRSGAAERAASVLTEWAASLPAAAPRPVPQNRPARARPALWLRHSTAITPIGTITVGMPYRGCPELVGRAVRSVLAQTYRDLRLIVIGDGEAPPLDGFDDPRLSVYVLPERRGPYFAHAVALAASSDAWYAPHDADDWSSPDHLARLATIERAHGKGAVICGAMWRTTDGVERSLRAQSWMGLYARQRLIDVGGFDVGRQVAQDSFLVKLLRLTGPVAQQDRPTYHAVRRTGSLTQATETGMGSPMRTEVKARDAALLAELSGRSVSAIRLRRRAGMPKDLRDEVERHARALRRQLAAEVVG